MQRTQPSRLNESGLRINASGWFGPGKPGGTISRRAADAGMPTPPRRNAARETAPRLKTVNGVPGSKDTPGDFYLRDTPPSRIGSMALKATSDRARIVQQLTCQQPRSADVRTNWNRVHFESSRECPARAAGVSGGNIWSSRCQRSDVKSYRM